MLLNLTEFLQVNKVKMESFDKLIYQTLLLSLFERIYTDFKENPNKKIKLLERLRDSNQEVIVIKKFAYELYNVELTQHGATTIYKWLLCHFRKNGIRKKYDQLLKLKLLTKQNHQCNACGKSITLKNSQLDHIIPWAYVGDELEDNLHMLCTKCNRSKNKSITFLLSTLLMRSNDLTQAI